MSALTADLVEARLTGRTRTVSQAKGRAAAVLIAFSQNGPRTQLTLIRRTDTMRQHRGQYAFPGGSRDADDASPVQTALREAQEEVGIEPGDVRVLGLLDDLATITGFVITPVVGWIPHPYVYVPNAAEVALVVELPWEAFVKPPQSKTLLGEGLRRIVLAYEIDGHFVWGATASLVRNLVNVLLPEASV